MFKINLRIYLPKFIRLCLLLLTVITLRLVVNITQTGKSETPAHADAAIILGTGVWRGQPTPVFRERINHAVNLYHGGTIDYLIFTGGVGWGDELAEAEVGRNYAIAHGVPPEAIFIETTSRDTYTNIQNAAKIVRQQDFEGIIIISDPYYLHRALIIAQLHGIDAHVSATPTTRYQSPRTKIPFLIVETTTIARYHFALFFGRPATQAAQIL